MDSRSWPTLSKPKANRVMGVSVDITERKLAEEALAESQAQILALFNSTNDMIWSVDPETFGLVTFNSGLKDYFFNRLQAFEGSHSGSSFRYQRGNDTAG